MRQGGILSTRNKILLHLLDNQKLKDNFEVLSSVTQGGVSAAVEVTTATVSPLLRDLVNQNYIFKMQKSVHGKQRKQWAYFLTEQGFAQAQLLKNSLEESPLDKKFLELTKNGKRTKPRDALKNYLEALALIEEEKKGNERDRLKLNVLSEIGKLYLELRDTNQSMNSWIKILKLSQELEDRRKEAEAYLHIGIVQEIKNEWQSAESNFTKAYAISDNVGDVLTTVEAGRHLGRVYWRLGKFKDAIFYFTKCLERLTKKQDNLNSMTSIYTDLGNVYSDMGEIDKAINYYNKSLELSTKTKNRHESIRARHNIGYAYQTMGEYDKALEHYEKCLKLALESDSTEDIGHAYINAGYCYAKLSKTRNALEYTKKGLEIFELSNDLNMISGAQRNYGMIYSSKRQWKKSKEHFKKSIEILEELNTPYHLAWTYFDYGLTLKSKGDKKWKDFLKKALKIYEELNSVKDVKKVKRALKKKVK